MNLYEKLLEIQRGVDSFVKDGKNQSDKYKYVTSDAVLDVIRPKMNELGLLLIPQTVSGSVHEGTTKSGTTRYMTELNKLFVWVDVESGEKLEIPFYAQGVDLAGEKGVGKAETYAEKYFLMKLFHVPTSNDDPDGDGRTGNGEKKQRGTQAEKETTDYQRKSIKQMLNELCESNAEMMKSALITLTKSSSRGYEGAESVESIHDKAVSVAYSRLKNKYEEKFGREFKLSETDEPTP